MLVFVDYEHADATDADWGQRVQAARTWITYRLEDVSERPCHLVRYDRISSDLLEQLGAEAIFISGNGTDPARYDPDELHPLRSIVRDSGLPVFGFCGGFQAMTNALGAAVVPLDLPDEAEEGDMIIRFPSGRLGEFGYHPVELVADHPLLAGLGDAPVFRHAHGLHVPELPPGFEAVARSEVTPVQMAVNDDRRMVGTQFHPEYWTDDHPAGRTLIENFLRWIGLVD